MPFDPTLPIANTEIDAVQMRGQLNGLADLIAAVPGLTDVVIDAVTTLNPGEPATVTASVIGTVLHLSLGIPRGNDGGQGATGSSGSDGAPGGPGPQGPPFATVIIDAVNTLPPGSTATVEATFDGTHVHLIFGIPQGAPGEVSNADLAAAITTTSANSNAVATLDTPFADPDAEALRQKLNEFLLAARR